MPINKISATLSANDLNEIKQALSTIRGKLPFLISLSVDERKRLARLGDRSRAFVSKALEVATQTPDFLPRSFDIEEMRKDVELFQALDSIRLDLMKLAEQVDDTYETAGSEAYAAALVVYRMLKDSDSGTEGLDSVADELAQRFARKSKTQKPNKTS